MNIYCSRDPIVHFPPYPHSLFRGNHSRSYVAASFCLSVFSSVQREARQQEGERGSRVAEVVEAKESLNYKTTDVDDRPKNAAGRGGLSICLALMTTNCFLLFQPRTYSSYPKRDNDGI